MILVNKTHSEDTCAHEVLKAANINPSTGLSTNYLNHFVEFVILAENLPTMPAFLDDLLDWQPMSYSDHVRASKLKYTEKILECYENADPAVIKLLDSITNELNKAVLSIQNQARGLSEDTPRGDFEKLAEQVTNVVRPPLESASTVINLGQSSIDRRTNRLPCHLAAHMASC